MKTFQLISTLTLCALLCSSAAYAQATRTWVSGVGDDVNPCSRTAPCKTFAGAISKTAAGGEISVLDPGGYGAVTITKSITIDGDGTLAGISGSLTTGVIVNDTASAFPGTIKVVLRNIAILGAGRPGTPSGITGVSMVRGGKLVLDNVSIYGFQNGVTTTIGEATIINSTIAMNSSFGVHALTGSSSITIEDSFVVNNGTGVQAETGTTIRLIDNGFYSNGIQIGCGAGTTGTLVSAGDNRRPNNRVAGASCAPTVAVVLQ